MNETKTCPKCAGEMQSDRHLATYTEVTLAKEDEYSGDSMKVLYCQNCGYIELYRQKKHDL